MDNLEALRLLDELLDRFRQEPYESLTARIDADPLVQERQGGSGPSYQVELQFVWDDRPDGDVRVIGSIDDGGWRSLVPLTRSFIKAADGRLVGE